MGESFREQRVRFSRQRVMILNTQNLSLGHHGAFTVSRLTSPSETTSGIEREIGNWLGSWHRAKVFIVSCSQTDRRGLASSGSGRKKKATVSLAQKSQTLVVLFTRGHGDEERTLAVLQTCATSLWAVGVESMEIPPCVSDT